MGTRFALRKVKYTVSSLERKIKDSITRGRRRKKAFSLSLLPHPAPYPPFFSFFSRLGGKEKHKQGNSGDKSMFLSAGALRWIRPGFGKVKWDLAIKSLQAKHQEPLS